ncbi:MAG: alpha/beta hydrolase family protein, partial [Halobaculum sp.]
TQWTPVGTCGIPREAFRLPETIHYETFDGREIPAYWTLPAGVDETDTVPVIVDIHGGPEHQRRPWFYPTKQFFLDRGFAVLEPNVRGSSGYGAAYSHLDDVEKRLDSVRDIEQAVEWLTDQPAVDPDRVVAYGRSYGGFVVLSAITQYPDLWAGAVEFVGIADFTTFLENTGEWRRAHREAEYGSLEEDRELLEEISPIRDIDQIDCPLFVQHGANDPRVPVSEARQVIETAREQGVRVESLIFEDEGHHTTSRENLIDEFERIAAFLDDICRSP